MKHAIVEEHLISQILGEAFRRQNESPDEEFYRVPRLVTHINAQNYKTT